jgi:hypothetical protein
MDSSAILYIKTFYRKVPVLEKTYARSTKTRDFMDRTYYLMSISSSKKAFSRMGAGNG